MYSVNLTLLILTFHALTETVVVFLTSLFVFLTCRGYLVGSSRKQFTLLFVLSLLTVTKPVFLLMLGVYVAYLFLKGLELVGLRHHGSLSRLPSLGLFILALSPLLAQFCLSFLLLGKPSLLETGEENLNYRLLPRAYAITQNRQEDFQTNREYRQSLIAELDPESWSTWKKLAFLGSNFGATARAVYTNLVRSNLLAHSHFLPMNNKFRQFSALYNAIAACLHGFVLLVALPYLIASRLETGEGEFLTVLLLLNCSIILPSALVDQQGDRIVAIATPVWIVTYGYIFSRILGGSKCPTARIGRD